MKIKKGKITITHSFRSIIKDKGERKVTVTVIRTFDFLDKKSEEDEPVNVKEYGQEK